MGAKKYTEFSSAQVVVLLSFPVLGAEVRGTASVCGSIWSSPPSPAQGPGAIYPTLQGHNDRSACQLTPALSFVGGDLTNPSFSLCHVRSVCWTPPGPRGWSPGKGLSAASHSSLREEQRLTNHNRPVCSHKPSLSSSLVSLQISLQIWLRNRDLDLPKLEEELPRWVK